MISTEFALDEGDFSSRVEDFFHDKKKERIELAIGEWFDELDGL